MSCVRVFFFLAALTALCAGAAAAEGTSQNTAAPVPAAPAAAADEAVSNLNSVAVPSADDAVSVLEDTEEKADSRIVTDGTIYRWGFRCYASRESAPAYRCGIFCCSDSGCDFAH